MLGLHNLEPMLGLRRIFFVGCKRLYRPALMLSVTRMMVYLTYGFDFALVAANLIPELPKDNYFM